MATKPVAVASENMYKVKPYYDSDACVDVPGCMYKLKCVYSEQIGSASNEEINLDLMQLEERQESILSRLKALKNVLDNLSKQSIGAGVERTAEKPTHSTKVNSSVKRENLVQSGIIKDIVINVNPSSIPYSLLVLQHNLSQKYKLLSACHVHSSAKDIPEKLRRIFGENGLVINRGEHQLAFTIIWKDDKHGPSLMISPSVQTSIQGEGNIARYLDKLMSPSQECNDVVRSTKIDQWVDTATQILKGSTKEKAAGVKALNVQLGKQAYLMNEAISLADIVAWSAVTQSDMVSKLPNNVKTWYDTLGGLEMFNCVSSLL